MVAIRPYLAVSNAKQALDDYNEVFGIEVKTRMPFEKEAGMSMGLPEDYDWENSTMHSEFSIDGQMLYMSDDVRGGEPGAQKVSILLEIESKDIIDKIYKNVESKGWKINSKLEKTFWGAWFAQFDDDYGINWQLNFQEESYEG